MLNRTLVGNGLVGASLNLVALIRLVLKALCVEQDQGEMVLLNRALVTWSGCRNRTWSGCFGSSRELSRLNRTKVFDGLVVV
jgi:hypothetical protein